MAELPGFGSFNERDITSFLHRVDANHTFVARSNADKRILQALYDADPTLFVTNTNGYAGLGERVIGDGTKFKFSNSTGKRWVSGVRAEAMDLADMHQEILDDLAANDKIGGKKLADEQKRIDALRGEYDPNAELGAAEKQARIKDAQARKQSINESAPVLEEAVQPDDPFTTGQPQNPNDPKYNPNDYDARYDSYIGYEENGRNPERYPYRSVEEVLADDTLTASQKNLEIESILAREKAVGTDVPYPRYDAANNRHVEDTKKSLETPEGQIPQPNPKDTPEILDEVKGDRSWVEQMRGTEKYGPDDIVGPGNDNPARDPNVDKTYDNDYRASEQGRQVYNDPYGPESTARREAFIEEQKRIIDGRLKGGTIGPEQHAAEMAALDDWSKGPFPEVTQNPPAGPSPVNSPKSEAAAGTTHPARNYGYDASSEKYQRLWEDYNVPKDPFNTQSPGETRYLGPDATPQGGDPVVEWTPKPGPNVEPTSRAKSYEDLFGPPGSEQGKVAQPPRESKPVLPKPEKSLTGPASDDMIAELERQMDIPNYQKKGYEEEFKRNDFFDYGPEAKVKEIKTWADGLMDEIMQNPSSANTENEIARFLRHFDQSVNLESPLNGTRNEYIQNLYNNDLEFSNKVDAIRRQWEGVHPNTSPDRWMAFNKGRESVAGDAGALERGSLEYQYGELKDQLNRWWSGELNTGQVDNLVEDLIGLQQDPGVIEMARKDPEFRSLIDEFASRVDLGVSNPKDYADISKMFLPEGYGPYPGKDRLGAVEPDTSLVDEGATFYDPEEPLHQREVLADEFGPDARQRYDTTNKTAPESYRRPLKNGQSFEDVVARNPIDQSAYELERAMQEGPVRDALDRLAFEWNEWADKGGEASDLLDEFDSFTNHGDPTAGGYAEGYNYGGKMGPGSIANEIEGLTGADREVLAEILNTDPHWQARIDELARAYEREGGIDANRLLFDRYYGADEAALRRQYLPDWYEPDTVAQKYSDRIGPAEDAGASFYDPDGPGPVPDPNDPFSTSSPPPESYQPPLENGRPFKEQTFKYRPEGSEFEYDNLGDPVPLDDMPRRGAASAINPQNFDEFAQYMDLYLKGDLSQTESQNLFAHFRREFDEAFRIGEENNPLINRIIQEREFNPDSQFVQNYDKFIDDWQQWDATFGNEGVLNPGLPTPPDHYIPHPDVVEPTGAAWPDTLEGVDGPAPASSMDMPAPDMPKEVPMTSGFGDALSETPEARLARAMNGEPAWVEKGNGKGFHPKAGIHEGEVVQFKNSYITGGMDVGEIVEFNPKGMPKNTVRVRLTTGQIVDTPASTLHLLHGPEPIATQLAGSSLADVGPAASMESKPVLPETPTATGTVPPKSAPVLPPEVTVPSAPVLDLASPASNPVLPPQGPRINPITGQPLNPGLEEIPAGGVFDRPRSYRAPLTNGVPIGEQGIPTLGGVTPAGEIPIKAGPVTTNGIITGDGAGAAGGGGGAVSKAAAEAAAAGGGETAALSGLARAGAFGKNFVGGAFGPVGMGGMLGGIAAGMVGSKLDNPEWRDNPGELNSSDVGQFLKGAGGTASWALPLAAGVTAATGIGGAVAYPLAGAAVLGSGIYNALRTKKETPEQQLDAMYNAFKGSRMALSRLDFNDAKAMYKSYVENGMPPLEAAAQAKQYMSQIGQQNMQSSQQNMYMPTAKDIIGVQNNYAKMLADSEAQNNLYLNAALAQTNNLSGDLGPYGGMVQAQAMGLRSSIENANHSARVAALTAPYYNGIMSAQKQALAGYPVTVQGGLSMGSQITGMNPLNPQGQNPLAQYGLTG